jgi:hypothetical protein
MLGGQPGDRLGLELGQLLDCLGLRCEALAKFGDLCFEPFDLGIAGIGDLTDLLESAEGSLELLGQVLVRAGPGDSGFGGQGLQVLTR